MTRRNFVSLAAVAAFTGAPPRSRMGIATTSYMTFGKPDDPYAFLEHCHALGAAGVQMALKGDIGKLRARAEALEMYLEAMVPLPKSGDTAAFEKGLREAKEAGALCVRTGGGGGRRYEQFSSFADWQTFAAGQRAAVKAAVPVAERVKMPLALENHKDWTLDEMLALLAATQSEYLGVCLDFGNNISLLDDPMQVVLQLAPYAVSTHVKDMGVESYAEGFLLSEVPLGEGYLNLPGMVAAVRKARPNTRFTLEMITRNPLQVPCLTDKYWATFPDRNGAYLSRTLRTVLKEGNRLQTLPRVDGQTRGNQLRLEEENVKICLHYGREKLAL